MTTHSWDEDPQGEWTLEIENVAANGRDYGNLTRHNEMFSLGTFILTAPSPTRALSHIVMRL